MQVLNSGTSHTAPSLVKKTCCAYTKLLYSTKTIHASTHQHINTSTHQHLRCAGDDGLLVGIHRHSGSGARPVGTIGVIIAGIVVVGAVMGLAHYLAQHLRWRIERGFRHRVLFWSNSSCNFCEFSNSEPYHDTTECARDIRV